MSRYSLRRWGQRWELQLKGFGCEGRDGKGKPERVSFDLETQNGNKGKDSPFEGIVLDHSDDLNSGSTSRKRRGDRLSPGCRRSCCRRRDLRRRDADRTLPGSGFGNFRRGDRRGWRSSGCTGWGIRSGTAGRGGRRNSNQFENRSTRRLKEGETNDKVESNDKVEVDEPERTTTVMVEVGPEMEARAEEGETRTDVTVVVRGAGDEADEPDVD